MVHYARKPTKLYVFAAVKKFPELIWGHITMKLDAADWLARIGLKIAASKKLGEVCGKGGGVDSMPAYTHQPHSANCSRASRRGLTPRQATLRLPRKT